jgi:DnaD/phage-associated family protein
MAYRIERHSNYFLDDTQVPNVFIAEYLPAAPGDYVKVYLYAYMKAAGREILSNDAIAEELGMKAEDVLAAWSYFEKRGLIRKSYPDPADTLRYDVVFTDIKGLVFGAGSKADDADSGERLRSALDEEDVREMFRDVERVAGRPLAGSDVARLGALLEESASPALITYAYGYCAERRHNTRAPYVAEVVRRWMEEGVKTPEDAEAHLLNTDVRMDQYRQIMKALGLHFSSITEAEKRVFDGWLDGMGFTMGEILDAADKAAGKRNKYDYVKKILESDHEARQTTDPHLRKDPSGEAGRRERYYAEARARAESEAEAHRREVYAKLPDVERIDRDLARLNRASVSAVLSRSDGGRRESARISAEIERKVAEKADVMARAGYPADYMDVHYRCGLCSDTGIRADGGACGCFATEIVLDSPNNSVYW